MKVKEPKKLVALKAISDVRKTQHQMQKDQNNILQENKECFEENFQDVNLENFTSKIQEQISVILME